MCFCCILSCFCCNFFVKLHNPSYLQSQTGEELTVEEPVSKTEEEIHYGEIDFSKQRNKSPPVPEQDGGQTEDPLYAQVKVSETANRPEDLYAQVKKKSDTLTYVVYK